MITIATDGACANNPNGLAAWAWYENDESWQVGTFDVASNNVAELTGIIKALEVTNLYPQDVLILSDSRYAINCLTVWCHNWERNGWRKRPSSDNIMGKLANEKLIRHGVEQFRVKPNVKIEWVKGHNGHPLNENADRLCSGAVEQMKLGLPVDFGPGLKC